MTPDYLRFQLWAVPAHITGWMSTSLATSSLLKAVGVGNSAVGATAAAAAIKWITKDGIGAAGRVLVSAIINSTCSHELLHLLNLALSGCAAQAGVAKLKNKSRENLLQWIWDTRPKEDDLGLLVSMAQTANISGADPRKQWCLSWHKQALAPGCLQSQYLISAVQLGERSQKSHTRHISCTLQVGGRLGNVFDEDPKRWRMVAEAFLTVGLALEIATAFSPANFIVLAGAGNLSRAVGRGMTNPCFRIIQTHFAAASNVGDVAAKEEVSR